MTLNIKQQSTKVSTTGQITLDDLAQIRASGFLTIIINRPDAEAAGLHVQSACVRRAAAEHGMTVVYLPVIPNAISDGQVKAFAEAVATASGPVLAYCATGNRAATLAARSALEKPPDMREPNLSPKLAALRTDGVVNTTRGGKRISDSIVDPTVGHLLEGLYTIYSIKE
jgi:sulfide:quinone oxidoreductase